MAALQELRGDLKREMHKSDDVVKAIKKDQNEMKLQHLDLINRVERMEHANSSKGGSTVASDGGGRRPAIVFGGWKEDTARQELLTQLEVALQAAGVSNERLLDEKPWTSGPRRSVALAAFEVRKDEDYRTMERRMLRAVSLINEHKKANQSKGEVKIWAAVSKDAGARQKSSHTSKMRRVLYALDVGVGDTENDYSEGSLWLKGRLLGSATREGPKGIKLMPGRSPSSWFSPQALAEVAELDVQTVEEAWQCALQARRSDN